MKNLTHKAMILWDRDFIPLVAISFSHEFHMAGVHVTEVNIHGQGAQNSASMISPSAQTLQETMDRVEEIDCLVIPTSITALGHFQQHPMLWQLIDAVRANGGKIVIGGAQGAVDPALAALLPPGAQMMLYPLPTMLLPFARWVAHLLVDGDEPHNRRRNGSLPPLVRVTSDAVPPKLAGAIAGIVRDYGYAEAQAIGAAASGQMLKAVAIAKSYLATDKMALFAIPHFTNVQLGGELRSANRLFVSVWPVGMDKEFGFDPFSSRVSVSADD